MEGQLSAHSPPTMWVLGPKLRWWARRQVPLAAAELPPQAPCRVSFLLFTSLRLMVFEEFRDCFSCPLLFETRVLNNPGWLRSQKLDPKVIKYWGHRLATVLGTCVTALLTWAFRSSRCHPAVFLLCVRGGLLCIRGDLLCVRGGLLSTVSGSYRRLCPDHHLSIITFRASSQSRFFLTHFVYDLEKTPIFLWPWWKQKGIKRGCIYSLSQSSQEQDAIVIFQKLRSCLKLYCVWHYRRFCLLAFQILFTFIVKYLFE